MKSLIKSVLCATLYKEERGNNTSQAVDIKPTLHISTNCTYDNVQNLNVKVIKEVVSMRAVTQNLLL